MRRAAGWKRRRRQPASWPVAPGSPRPSRSRWASPERATRCRGRCRPGCPAVVATDEDPGESVAFAHDLAEFIGGVRAIDTRGRTFSGQGRGGDLRVPRRVDGDLLRAQRTAPGRPAAPPDVGGHAEAAARRRRRRDDPRRSHSRQRARLRRPPGRDPRRRRPGTGRPCAGSGGRLASARGRTAAGAPRRPRAATTSSGSAARPGPSSRRWARSGTTSRATRR